MASSLLALLSQQSSTLQTRKALILTSLQNDFLSPDGKLPVNLPSGFLERLKVLVPTFREHGHVIWVRSEFETNRPVNSDDEIGDTVIVGPIVEDEAVQEESDHDDDERDSPVPFKKVRVSLDGVDSPKPASVGRIDEDEELFLTRTATKEPCCIPGSAGASYASQVLDFIDEKKDMQVTKTCYSAFGSTSLLTTLRSKLITDLYVCGCTTNLSVYATAMDAARHGITITLIDDCLGYRRKDRHDLAMTRLRDIVGAEVMTSEEVIESLRTPSSLDKGAEDEQNDDDVVAGEDAEGVSLEVDSDAEDNDLVKHWSRHYTLSNRMLALRSGSPATTGSNTRHQDREQKKHTEDIYTSAVGDGYTDNDSSTPVTRKEPWADIIEGQDKKSVEPSSSKHPGLAAMAAVVGLDQRTVTEYEEMLTQARSQAQKSRTCQSQPLFGQDKETESGQSRIYFDLLPAEIAETIFQELNKELIWERMRHQAGEVPRLVCCQGTMGQDGSMPVYRHPSDQTMPTQAWTPTVDKVRKAAEEVVGHSLNHALIQLYRGGPDFISEHTDKTLDIVKESSIVNISFGAQRTMRLRTKRTAASEISDLSPARTTYRVPMPHNSMIKMSLSTNAEYLHGIMADKRPQVELTDDEKAFDGQRISITFRNIGTYLTEDSSCIYGQGAIGKTKDQARPVINADATESESLVRAFGMENQSSKMDWDATYGAGFDVLHLK